MGISAEEEQSNKKRPRLCRSETDCPGVVCFQYAAYCSLTDSNKIYTLKDMVITGQPTQTQ